MVRQLADEAHRVGDDRLLVLAHVHFTGQRVERREEPVLDEDIAIATQAAQDGGLSGVGVADQRHLERIAPGLALHLARALHFDEPLLQHPDAMADEAAVSFELRFTRTPEADTAARLLEVGPHPRQAREHVLELRQFDLQPRLPAAGARREDVEDDFGPVHDAAPGRILDVLPLRRRQLVVEQDERDILGGDALAQFVDLALPQVGRGIRPVELLCQRANDLRPRRVGESFQLEQVFVEVVLRVRPLQRRADEQRAFNRRREIYDVSGYWSGDFRVELRADCFLLLLILRAGARAVTGALRLSTLRSSTHQRIVVSRPRPEYGLVNEPIGVPTVISPETV